MIPLTIQEILELPIGSKVVVKSEQKLSDRVKRRTFNYQVSSVSTERITLDKEVINNVQSFLEIDLSKTSTGTVIRYPYFDGVTEQVFLDESGVDRVYSNKATFKPVKRKTVLASGSLRGTSIAAFHYLPIR
jgi:hypothetical protein